jgi:hypothetical protein
MVGRGTWYPSRGVQGAGAGWSTDCTPYEKSLIERANQYLKDRIQEFDDYYPCMKKGCDLGHVRN